MTVLREARLVVVDLMMLVLTVSLFGCAPMGPSGGRTERGQVGFNLGGDTMLGLAGQEPSLLRIRTFKVVNDVTAEQEGNDHEFVIDMSGGTFTVTGITLGMKEFQLAVLNPAREVLGEGKARVLVKPGSQTVPQLVMTINTGPRRRRLDMSMFVTMSTPGDVPKVTYRDTKPIVHDCANSCHNAVNGHSPEGGLDLSGFPFTHETRVMSQAEIISEMAMWMREMNPLYRMPPPPGAAVPEADIAKLDQWVTDGMLKFPMADNVDDLARKIVVTWTLQGSAETGVATLIRPDDDSPFMGVGNDFVIEGTYDYELAVYGINGDLVYLEHLGNQIVKGSGALEYVIQIPYTNPSVTIPVIIQPAH